MKFSRFATVKLFTLALAATIICVPATPAGASESALLREFLKTTGLQEVDYQLTSGPESCLEGHMSVLDLGDHLTLMLGARPLAFDIGLGMHSFQERGCKIESGGSFSDRAIFSQHTEDCRDGKFAFEIKIAVLKNGNVRYSRAVRQGGKIISHDNCELRPRSP